MCRAFNHDLHADCFTCATCGSSLKNQGHHFLNDKFYCDIHGRQLKGRGPSMDPEMAVRTPPSAAQPVRNPEPVKAFYQPEVMTRQPVQLQQSQQMLQQLQSVSPTPWNTQSPISPSKRGVPPAQGGYVQQQFKQTTTNNHYESSPTQLTPNTLSVGNNNYARNDTIQQQHQQQQQHFENHQQTNNNHHHHHSDSIDGNRGKGTLQQYSNVNRIPYCEHCKQQIRGAFVLATGLTWCPEHFTCANQSCNRKLLDVGFVEEKGKKYCEQCFERLIAPQCSKCRKPITADCLNALQKQWHPHCFVCAHCHKPFGNSAFYLEQGQPYCEEDWNSLFTTKCISCKYPIEAGDRWVEALGSAFHSNCFNCTTCQVNLEGESFYAKNGAPYCKSHC